MTADGPRENGIRESRIGGDRIDLLFPALGEQVPAGCGYAMYSAISRLIPSVHESRNIGIFPIRGRSAGDEMLRLMPHSAVRFRLPADQLPSLLPLAGKALDLDGHRVRLGVPTVAALVPAPTLVADLVIIKLADVGEKSTGIIKPTAFLSAAEKQLSALSIAGTLHLQAVRTGPRAGEPRRRVLKIKGRTAVGYSMIVEGLTAEESIRLQEHGLGGRRLMGCGLFLPDRRN